MTVGTLIRRRAVGTAPAGGGGPVTSPVVGATTPFSNSDIISGARQFTFPHTTAISGSDHGLLLCVWMKGSTNVNGGHPFTIDKVAFNNSLMAEIGRSGGLLAGTAPTLLAFYLASPPAGLFDVEFDITPAGGEVQVVAMQAVNLTNCGGPGTGVDQDSANTPATGLSLIVPVGANDGRVFGMPAVQGGPVGGDFTIPAGYAEHINTGTGSSNSTDLGFASHSIAVAAAGNQTYSTSWGSLDSYGGLAFQLLGA